MKEKCDNCGQISDIYFEWIYREGSFFGYRLKFCTACGIKIEKILKEGVN